MGGRFLVCDKLLEAHTTCDELLIPPPPARLSSLQLHIISRTFYTKQRVCTVLYVSVCILNMIEIKCDCLNGRNSRAGINNAILIISQ